MNGQYMERKERLLDGSSVLNALICLELSKRAEQLAYVFSQSHSLYLTFILGSSSAKLPFAAYS